jgi:hypothetical protein
MGASNSIVEEHRELLLKKYNESDGMSNAKRMSMLADELKDAMKQKHYDDLAARRAEEKKREEEELRQEELKLKAEHKKEELRLLKEASKFPSLRNRKRGQLGGSWNRVGVSAIPRPRSVTNIKTTKDVSDSGLLIEAGPAVACGPQSLDDAGKNSHFLVPFFPFLYLPYPYSPNP